MAFCKYCGAEIDESAKFCPQCGADQQYDAVYEPVSNSSSDDLGLVIKIFLVLGCISFGWFIIPLAWCIPMTVYAWKRIDRREKIGIGFGVCTLLFVSMIAGICLLVRSGSDN